MPITIKKIAEYAGVSIGTVSRALNNDPFIALKTKSKIKELARELDYVPNSIGKGLQSKKSFLIGFLISNIKNSFYDEILQGIGNVASKNNYGLLVGITEDNYKNEIEQLQLFREKAVDGIIVSNYQKETIQYLQRIEKSGIPVVVSDIEPYDLQTLTVRTDDVKASEITMEHLVKLGHTKIAYCYSINSNSINRYNACVAWSKKNKIQEPVLCQNISELLSLLKTEKKPTAIICYSDWIAIEIIQTLNQNNFKVPEDISIVGFDNIDIAKWPEFQLTTIQQPKTELGKLSAKLLFNIINKNNNVNSIIIEPELVVRNSTRDIK